MTIHPTPHHVYILYASASVVFVSVLGFRSPGDDGDGARRHGDPVVPLEPLRRFRLLDRCYICTNTRSTTTVVSVDCTDTREVRVRPAWARAGSVPPAG